MVFKLPHMGYEMSACVVLFVEYFCSAQFRDIGIKSQVEAEVEDSCFLCLAYVGDPGKEFFQAHFSAFCSATVRFL